MTREEARKAAEVMLAYAEGKEIEYLSHKSNKWELVCRGDDKHSNLALDFHKYKYRIKKEPKYRPFKDKEECWAEMQKHQPFGWITLKIGNHPESKAFVIKLTENCFYFIGDGNCVTHNLYDYEFDKHFWSFADGTPFGIKEE